MYGNNRVPNPCSNIIVYIKGHVPHKFFNVLFDMFLDFVHDFVHDVKICHRNNIQCHSFYQFVHT